MQDAVNLGAVTDARNQRTSACIPSAVQLVLMKR